MANQNNPWLPWLEENPETLYKAFLPQGSNNFRDYYLSNYNKIYGDYMGNLGKQALGGNAPSMNFSDYLNGFNFNNNWRSLSPLARGQRNTGRIMWNV
jgi:hypothetical protein